MVTIDTTKSGAVLSPAVRLGSDRGQSTVRLPGLTHTNVVP